METQDLLIQSFIANIHWVSTRCQVLYLLSWAKNRPSITTSWEVRSWVNKWKSMYILNRDKCYEGKFLRACNCDIKVCIFGGADSSMIKWNFFAYGEFGICFIISETLADILNRNYDNSPHLLSLIMGPLF